jgi:hypothetical protein
MRLWANDKVIIFVEDEQDRDALISELGLDPINPNPDKTLDEITKILQKAYPNINVKLNTSWHELWEGETVIIDDKYKSIQNIKDEKKSKKETRGIVAELKEDKWLSTEP